MKIGCGLNGITRCGVKGISGCGQVGLFWRGLSGCVLEISGCDLDMGEHKGSHKCVSLKGTVGVVQWE